MNTYILNVTAGKEEYSADLLRSLTALSSYHFWVPQKPVFYRSQGSVELIHTVLYPSYVFVDSEEFYPLLAALREHHLYSYLFSAFLAKGTDGVMKTEVLSLFLLFSIPDILFLQGRHTTEHVEVSGGAV